MMNIVKNSAKDSSTWFGGTACVPSACRRKANTITILVKEVTMMNKAGAKESTVRRIKIWITTAVCFGPSGPKSILTEGPTAAASEGGMVSSAIVPTMITDKRRGRDSYLSVMKSLVVMKDAERSAL